MRITRVTPEPPRDMEHIQMRQTFADPIEAVIQISRFEQRRIEALSIEADERASTGQLPSDGIEQRSFVTQSNQQVLARHERPVRVEATTPDKEGDCSGAATQPGGFKVEEDEWLANCRSTKQLRCLAGICDSARQGSNRFATVPLQWTELGLYDEARKCAELTPLTAKNEFDVVVWLPTRTQRASDVGRPLRRWD
jgi:hypothetical protein